MVAVPHGGNDTIRNSLVVHPVGLASHLEECLIFFVAPGKVFSDSGLLGFSN